MFSQDTHLVRPNLIYVNPEKSFRGTNGEPPSEASQLRKGGAGVPPEMFKNLYCKWCNVSLHCAMPQSGNFAIQAKSLFQSSLNLHFLFGASRLFTGGSAITYPENVENSARNHPDRLRKTLRPTFQRSNLGTVG